MVGGDDGAVEGVAGAEVFVAVTTSKSPANWTLSPAVTEVHKATTIIQSDNCKTITILKKRARRLLIVTRRRNRIRIRNTSHKR